MTDFQLFLSGDADEKTKAQNKQKYAVDTDNKFPSQFNIARQIYNTWNHSKSANSRREVQFDVFANWVLTDKGKKQFNFKKFKYSKPKENYAWIIDHSSSLNEQIGKIMKQAADDDDFDDRIENFLGKNAITELKYRLENEKDLENELDIEVLVADDADPFVFIDNNKAPNLFKELYNIILSFD